MDQLFLILISEYTTEDQVSIEIDLDTMVSLSEWYYPEVVNRDTNLKSIEINICWSGTYWKVYYISLFKLFGSLNLISIMFLICILRYDTNWYWFIDLS